MDNQLFTQHPIPACGEFRLEVISWLRWIAYWQMPYRERRRVPRPRNPFHMPLPGEVLDEGE